MKESIQALVQHNRAMAVEKSPGPRTLIRWGKLGAVFGEVRRSSCSCGRPCRARTCDPLIKSQMLCQLS